jgi:hypothetical protein
MISKQRTCKNLEFRIDPELALLGYQVVATVEHAPGSALSRRVTAWGSDGVLTLKKDSRIVLTLKLPDPEQLWLSEIVEDAA